MAKNNNKKLEILLQKADKKLCEAQKARKDVMTYLKEYYDIDTDYNAEYLEEESILCYGIHIRHMQELLKKEDMA